MSAVLRATIGRHQKRHGRTCSGHPDLFAPHCLRNRDARVKPAHDGRENLNAMNLRSGDEVRRKPVADHVGGHLDGAVFRIAPRALAGEALLRARNVVVDVDEGDVVEHHLAGRKLDQLVSSR